MRTGLALFLEAPHLKCGLRPESNVGAHVGELQLDELVARERYPELLACLRPHIPCKRAAAARRVSAA